MAWKDIYKFTAVAASKERVGFDWGWKTKTIYLYLKYPSFLI